MQQTAKKTDPVALAGAIHANTYANPLNQFAATYDQWGAVGQAYMSQPTITWQDTTSNATYSSASSVLNVT